MRKQNPQVESVGPALVQREIPEDFVYPQQEDEEVKIVGMQHSLTDVVLDRLKKSYPDSTLKKVRLNNQDFVLRPITSDQWVSDVQSWFESERAEGKEIPEHEIYKKFIECSVVFPAQPYELKQLAEKIVFWNNQLAGVPARLAKTIETISGFVNKDNVEESRLIVEDVSEIAAEERPDEEKIRSIVDKEVLPTRLVGMFGKFWILRGLKHTEYKQMQEQKMKDPYGDPESKMLRKAILLGENDLDELPAGISLFLKEQMKVISGLGEDNMFVDIIEDL